LTHFRNRIGPAGAEKIFSSSINLHGEKAREDEVVVDTTTQAVTDAKQRPGKQKSITFPTDTKLAAKIVKRGVKLAGRNNIALRQSYARTLPKLLMAQRGRRSKNGAARARKASRKLKTIAWRVVRQLDRSLALDPDHENPYKKAHVQVGKIAGGGQTSPGPS
jgi:IS5 family transposase